MQTREQRGGGQQVGQPGRAMVAPGNGSPIDVLRGTFERALPHLATVVPRGADPVKIMRLAIAAVSKDPKLLKCTPASLLLSLMQLTALGLEPNTPLQHAYIIGYNNKKYDPKTKTETWVDEAQPSIGYRGYFLLAQEAGAILDVDGDVVYEKDTCRVIRGSEPRIEHEPFLGGDAGPMVGVYTTWTLPNGVRKFRHWPAHRIAKYIEKYGFTPGYKGGPPKQKATYRDHPEAMALKGNIREAAKFWPMSSERGEKMRKAFEIDNREARGEGPDFTEERAKIAKEAPALGAILRETGDNPDAIYEPVLLDEAPDGQDERAADRKSDPAPARTHYGDDADNFHGNS